LYGWNCDEVVNNGINDIPKQEAAQLLDSDPDVADWRSTPLYLGSALVALGGLVLANIVAAVPGQIAARTPTALLLRAVSGRAARSPVAREIGPSNSSR
jgi:hypothetical protein